MCAPRDLHGEDWRRAGRLIRRRRWLDVFACFRECSELPRWTCRARSWRGWNVKRAPIVGFAAQKASTGSGFQGDRELPRGAYSCMIRECFRGISAAVAAVPGALAGWFLTINPAAVPGHKIAHFCAKCRLGCGVHAPNPSGSSCFRTERIRASPPVPMTLGN